LTKRCALQSLQLTLHAAVAETLTDKPHLMDALNESLARLLDASGVSVGAVYLLEPDGELVLHSFLGLQGTARSAAQDFFGHADLLRSVLNRGCAVKIPSPEVALDIGIDLLQRAQVAHMLIIPLITGSVPEGALIISSSERNVEAILASAAKTIGAQLAGTVALARALMRVSVSEERYRGLVAASSQIVWTMTAGGVVLEDSPTWRVYTGQSLEEFRAKGWISALHSDDQIGVIKAWKLALSTTVFFEIECRLRAADGHYGMFHLRSAPIIDSEGRVREWIGTCTDITTKIQADKAVRDSEARLRAIIDTALDALIGINAQGIIIDWNPRAEVIFGWARGEALGQKLADLIIPPRYREAHERGLQHFLRTGEGVVLNRPIEVAGLRRDGTEFPVELSISPLKQGETYVFNAFLSDITERKRAEEIRVRLASIVESSEDAIIGKTLDGIVTSWNRGAERTFGYTADEVIGKPIGLLIPQDRVEEESQFIERVKQGGRVSHFETVRRRKDGTELNIALTISPIQDEEGMIIGFSKIARDITEHKSLEAQLRQSQKMEGVGQLAGGIAHDFNNLLTVINSYSDMLLGEVGFDSPFVRNGLEQMKEAGHRAASLTRQLLMFSRQQVLEPKVLDLNEVVSNIAKLLRRLIGEDITLVLCPNPALGRVKVDPAQMEQVIMNLAVNARDAMPDGGQLTIETGNVELDHAYARTHALVQPGPYVMLAVSDTGCGMDAETQARIFEPFFTTKGVGKGTGLGLATVDGIVKQSSGNVWVYSEVGKGTTLKIYLPRVEQTSELPEPGAAPAALLRGSETVLLVEDEEMVRALAQAILERYGYRVLAARNVQDALRFAQESQEPIHLLLTDTIMPVMNGPELAKQFRSIRPETKVLFMSGYTDKVIAYTAALEPGTAFLQKPFTPETLTGKVREALNSTPQLHSTVRAA
jgi:PAS domain S-box-containing protein